MDKEPAVNDDDYVRMWYPNKEDSQNDWQHECGTEVIFLCQEGEIGLPVLQSTGKECVYVNHKLN